MPCDGLAVPTDMQVPLKPPGGIHPRGERPPTTAEIRSEDLPSAQPGEKGSQLGGQSIRLVAVDDVSFRDRTHQPDVDPV